MTAPVDAEGLSAEWLSAALGCEVRAVSAERIGTGQMAATYRLTIDADEMPATIVAKVAAGDAAARRVVRGGLVAEVRFYADLAATVDVRAPHCWYAAITDDPLSFTLLLEDLAPRRPGVQVDGCSATQAEDAARNLAGLHAPRWNDVTLYDLEYLRAPTPEGAAFMASMATSATEIFVDRYGPELSAADVATLCAAAEAMEAWILARPEPFALLHGDYRLDNLMFEPGGHDLVAVDWQTLGVGLPARDLSYFLAMSLSVTNRRAHEEHLVGRYHAQLLASGVVGYSLRQCFDDYRFGQLQGPLITTIGAAYAPGDRDEQAHAMFVSMAQRSCTAIRDLRTLELV